MAYLLACLAGCMGEDQQKEPMESAINPAETVVILPRRAVSTDVPREEPMSVQPAMERMLPLDPDGNGLYDDVERKALLDVLRELAPELRGPFDVDGDGRVTIEEQTAGRHPLSQIVPKRRIIDSPDKIPWGIDIFPEWIMSAFVQEDVVQGALAQHPARGVLDVTPAQDNADWQPRMFQVGDGVEFAAASGQHFIVPGHRDARWSYRWGVMTFRIDARAGSGGRTVLLDINQGDGPGKSSPRVRYDPEAGLHVRYVGRGKDGADKRVMRSDAVVADGATWNVVVFGMRQGRMFASLNGVPLASETEQPGRFSSVRVYDVTSFIGDQGEQSLTWAYDAIVLGQTELSEAMVRKLEGWAAHRLGFAGNLPPEHPYRARRPVLDVEDFPHRYVHDDETWNAWGESLNAALTRINTGGARVTPRGFERVFHDDFRAMRVTPSTSGEGDLWMGFGFNVAVGADAPLIEPGRVPDAYPHHDAGRGLQTVSLIRQGRRWRAGAFYSVNDMGQGYTWEGPKIFRIRCMFPEVPQEELPGGLFPAFWSYGTEFLFWRTSNRIEVDWFEFDGKNGRWYNGLSSHYHFSNVPNIFARQNESYKRYKVYSGELTEARRGIPGGVYFWDGRFRTWEFVVDEDMTYVNLMIEDGDGGERWVEVCRTPTPATYLERLDLQVNYALRRRDGVPMSDRMDFVIDHIEVFQKTAVLESIPAPFTARPRLSGEAVVGGTVVCEPFVEGVSDLRYYWFADDYPLTYGADNQIKLTEAEAGTKLRCMVKAVGARNMPEAWSDRMEVAR